MGDDNRALASCFDAVTESYHDAWPPYPAEIFDTIIGATGIRPPDRILEIGCGTGLATLSLAERGFTIVGLEPGARLAAEARRRLARFPLVRIEESSFEEWPALAKPFHAVVSAQAFHWVDFSIGLPKAAEALESGGSVALFWRRANHASPALGESLQRAHELCDLERPPLDRLGGAMERLAACIEACGCFEPLVVHSSRVSVRWNTESYLRLRSVYPGCIALPEAKRHRLLGEFARVIAEAGGSVPLELETTTYVARKRHRAPAWV
jgi:SAM-dependent methyltransferase